MVKKESVEILKAKDIQVTPQRLAIFEQLMGRKDHPSAEMIFNEIKMDFPSLTLVTVYNTLQKLVSSDLCIKVNRLHTSARYDGNTGVHQHLVCTHCQKIIDIHDASVSVELPELISEKFKIVDQSVTFYGTCVECQGTMRTSTTN
jgi:Fur family peroxide stress response transcriptional regulator